MDESTFLKKVEGYNLFQDLVGYQLFLATLCFLSNLDIPETRKLMKMAPEGISCVPNCEVSSARKAASKKEVVTPITSGRAVVVISGVKFRLLEHINWCLRHLPDVAHDVIELAEPEHIHGAGRKPVLHV